MRRMRLSGPKLPVLPVPLQISILLASVLYGKDYLGLESGFLMDLSQFSVPTLLFRGPAQSFHELPPHKGTYAKF